MPPGAHHPVCPPGDLGAAPRSAWRERLVDGIRRLWPALLAVLVLAAAWAGPLPRLAGVSFSAHMALHLTLVLVAAPLIAWSILRAGMLRGVHLGAGAALAFAGVEMVAVWSWHAPALHAAAALDPAAFALEQASFLIAGVLVWLPGFAAGGRRASLAGAVALAGSFAHMTMLGVLLAAAPALIYLPGLCGGAFGLDALSDQRVGGIMMAGIGGLAYLTAAVGFLARFMVSGSTPRHETEGPPH